MNITISKTIQVRQYEPLTVTISDDGDGTTVEGRKELYERVSKTLKSIIIKEYNKYDDLASEGTIEASKAMGATNLQIVMKILIPEAKPALISSISVMGISLVGYTAMAGAIGAGGLGNLAYLYGFVRQNNYVTYMATALILVIVFIIQFAGDYVVRKIDRR